MENTQKNQHSHNAPTRRKFNQLPKSTQERLLSKIKNNANGLVFATSNPLHSYIQIPIALAWFGVLFYLSNDYLWSDFKLIVFSVLSFFAAVLLVYNILKIARSISSPTKNCLIITPHHVIDLNFNDVSYWNMDQLIAVKGTNIYRSGTYASTQIDLSLVNGAKFFSVKNINKADEIVDKISEYKKLFLEATARIDKSYLSATNDFIELYDRPTQFAKPASNVLNYAITVVTSLILSAGLMFGAMLLNNYYDDVKSWNAAQTDNRASSYRKYLQSHSEGRWKVSAEQKLQNLYEEAEQKYLAKLNKGFDIKAVEAVKQAIRYAKETKNYKVKLVFERKNVIPPNIIEELKKSNNVKKVLSFGDAFTDEQINLREKSLSVKIAQAFSVVIPDDILEFSDECEDSCIKFLVKYIIDSDEIYYSTLEKKIPEKDRTWRPAVWFDWDFNIKTPLNSTDYNFQLTSDPAMNIYIDSDITEADVGKESFERKMEAEKSRFYNAVVESAFDDFKANLIYRTGIGVEPVRKPAEDVEQKSTPSSGSNQDVL